MLSKNRVWVLGAGFSYPLGAPLFSQLFTPTLQRIADIAIGNHYGGWLSTESFTSARDAMFAVYRDGLPNLKDASHTTFWENPEQFLQTINELEENFEASNPKRVLIREYITRQFDILVDGTSGLRKTPPNKKIEYVILAAKIELAVEVSFFVDGSKFDNESSELYRAWLSKLESGTDSIVTFNYDASLELIHASLKRKRNTLSIVDPHTAPFEGWANVPLMKMHGSVDRLRTSPTTTLPTSNRPYGFLTFEEGSSVDISVPGPAKLNSTRNQVWKVAEDAVRQASEIHIVGYRFPDTDIAAIRMFLNAMKNAENLHSVYIVLGPNTNGPDVQRLMSVFGGVRKNKVLVVPLARYAQDHLNCFVEGVHEL